MNSKLSLIAIIGRNRELGKNNKLLWNIPDDMAHFRKITVNHPVIMGRKTFASIGRPLPERTNIVITADPSFTADGMEIARSLDGAIEIAKKSPGHEEIFVVGGGQVYKEAIDRVDRLYLTVVDATADADTFFPDYSKFTKVIFEEPHKEGNPSYTYYTLA